VFNLSIKLIWDEVRLGNYLMAMGHSPGRHSRVLMSPPGSENGKVSIISGVIITMNIGIAFRQVLERIGREALCQR